MDNTFNKYDNRRPYSVNLKLNKYEYDMLNLKTERTHRNKSEFIRELICAACPVEAPPPRFYKTANELNKIGININQIAAQANATGHVSQEDIDFLKSLSKDIDDKLAELRKIVKTARPYSIEYFEMLAFKQQEAREEGLPEPQPGDRIITGIEYKNEDYPEEAYEDVVEVGNNYVVTPGNGNNMQDDSSNDKTDTPGETEANATDSNPYDIPDDSKYDTSNI